MKKLGDLLVPPETKSYLSEDPISASRLIFRDALIYALAEQRALVNARQNSDLQKDTLAIYNEMLRLWPKLNAALMRY